ncbi:DNA polymerase III subunit alpha, partial [Mangrovimonas sp. AS39]|nr:DNA polymerase III subunit alpha [Mangrovimonas futianensis]
DLTVALQPRTLDDLAVINALYRPGPIQAGYVTEYVARKSGKNPITYIHEAVKPVLQSTYGIFILQEQVMRLSQLLAGYTELQADELRKAIGRKVPELMAAEKDRFLKGCIAKGLVSSDAASKLFHEIEGCADYLFNRSHAYCYSLIGYITAWLKVNYPAEFWAALLSNNLKSDKTTTYVTAMKDEGVLLLPPDISN